MQACLEYNSEHMYDASYMYKDDDEASRFRASQIDASTSALPRIHRMLERIGKCLRDAVCMVVWRDLQELLERYLRKSRKAFVSNLEWEAESEVVGTSQSI